MIVTSWYRKKNSAPYCDRGKFLLLPPPPPLNLDGLWRSRKISATTPPPHRIWSACGDNGKVAPPQTKILATPLLPHTIVSDNVSSFTSDEFEQFCRNGAAERVVQTVKFGLRKPKGNMEDRLFILLARYQLTPHGTTGRAPAEFMPQTSPQTRYDHQYGTTLCRNKRTTNSGMTRMLPHALS